MGSMPGYGSLVVNSRGFWVGSPAFMILGEVVEVALGCFFCSCISSSNLFFRGALFVVLVLPKTP